MRAHTPFPQRSVSLAGAAPGSSPEQEHRPFVMPSLGSLRGAAFRAPGRAATVLQERGAAARQRSYCDTDLLDWSDVWEEGPLATWALH